MECDRQLRTWRPQTWPVATDWQPHVAKFLGSEPARDLGQFIESRLLQGATIYPPAPFRALELTPLAKVKVVILGQDPYHGPGQAHGLAFSVQAGVRIPPSLRNIQKEIGREARLSASGGSLEHWAQQGVLLLNTCLTVEDGMPASHAKRGWEALTDEIIRAVWSSNPCVVFMLWGAHAQAKRALLGASDKSHLVLCANHPSPLSALRPPVPFMGCGHFRLANDHFEKNHLAPVVW
jgi:uracil-DNA glycosylase